MKELWLITSPNTDTIWGTVLADSEEQARDVVDAGQADWLWPVEKTPAGSLSVHPSFTLIDGIWRELGMAGPGGDVLPEQVGDSVERRFGLLRPDDMWAVAGFTWFVVDYGTGYTDDRSGAVRLERQDEYFTCSNLHDATSSIDWEGEVLYRILEGWPAKAEHLPQAARAFDPKAEIWWDGDENNFQVPPRR